MTTLDDYFLESRLRPLRFVKCDIEGHELECFKGGARVLREDQPELLFECHEPEVRDGRLFDFLSELGYEGHFFFAGGLAPMSEIAERRDSIRKPFLNYMFLPRQRRAA